MPGAWVRLPDDRDCLYDLPLKKGDMVEVACYDDSGKDQGAAVLQLLSTPVKNHGWLFSAKMLTASDEYLLWWAANDGKTAAKASKYHVCNRGFADCEYDDEDHGEATHTDKIRLVFAKDLSEKKGLAWLVSNKPALKMLKASYVPSNPKEDDWDEDMEDDEGEEEEDEGAEDPEVDELRRELKGIKKRLAVRRKTKQSKASGSKAIVERGRSPAKGLFGEPGSERTQGRKSAEGAEKAFRDDSKKEKSSRNKTKGQKEPNKKGLISQAIYTCMDMAAYA